MLKRWLTGILQIAVWLEFIVLLFSFLFEQIWLVLVFSSECIVLFCLCGFTCAWRTFIIFLLFTFLILTFFLLLTFISTATFFTLLFNSELFLSDLECLSLNEYLLGFLLGEFLLEQLALHHVLHLQLVSLSPRALLQLRLDQLLQVILLRLVVRPLLTQLLLLCFLQFLLALLLLRFLFVFLPYFESFIGSLDNFSSNVDRPHFEKVRLIAISIFVLLILLFAFRPACVFALKVFYWFIRVEFQINFIFISKEFINHLILLDIRFYLNKDKTLLFF